MKIEEFTIGDVPVGETFEFMGKTYKVKETTSPSPCLLCPFKKDSPKNGCYYLTCFTRKDRKKVYYVEVDK